MSRSSLKSSSSKTNVKKKVDPPGILTLLKICKKHLYITEDGVEELEFVKRLKRARLDRLNLVDIDDGMKFLSDIMTHLYLQKV